MIVQLFIKAILFYFAFTVIRNLMRGVSQVKNAQSAKNEFPNQSGDAKKSGPSKSAEDVVEAEFRRL